MTDRKKCDWMMGCPRKPNSTTGYCDLHDAIVMVSDAESLLLKVLNVLDRIARKDREDNHESDV